ncbi:amidohydrolase family protein [Stappia sp. ICDLI1TA098]
MTHHPVVDAHHHFWRVARGDYHWMSPEMGAPLYRDYGPADLEPLLRRAGVDATVVVQAAASEAETLYLLDLAEATDFVAGVVGWLDMEDPRFAERLEAFRTHAKFVGIRPMLQDLEDDAYILRPAVLDSLAVLAQSNIAFDILTYPRHLPHVATALEQVPGLRAVVDHLSKPDIAGGGIGGWARDIARIADFPNVHCKLSGMITEADAGAWRPRDLEPFVDHVLAVFGPERLLYGSDWPVCLLAGSYAEAMNALRGVLCGKLPAAALADVFGRNAVRFYGLEL